MYNFEEIKAVIGGRKGYFVFTDYLEPIHADTEILYDKDGVFIQHNPGSEMLIKGLTEEHLKEIIESYVVDLEDPSDYDDDHYTYLETYNCGYNEASSKYVDIIGDMINYFEGRIDKSQLLIRVCEHTNDDTYSMTLLTDWLN